jgi:hypothetical protein
MFAGKHPLYSEYILGIPKAYGQKSAGLIGTKTNERRTSNVQHRTLNE